MGRWLFCGRDLSPTVVDALRRLPGGKTFPMKSLENNPWVTGKGEKGEARKGESQKGQPIEGMVDHILPSIPNG